MDDCWEEEEEEGVNIQSQIHSLCSFGFSFSGAGSCIHRAFAVHLN